MQGLVNEAAEVHRLPSEQPQWSPVMLHPYSHTLSIESSVCPNQNKNDVNLHLSCLRLTFSSFCFCKTHFVLVEDYF